MKETRCNIWDYLGKTDVIFITTNMEVTNDGHGVMGAGIALEAAKRYPVVLKTLGLENLRKNTLPAPLVKTREGTELWSFPTKNFGQVLLTEADVATNVMTYYRGKKHVGDYVPSWMQFSDPELIRTNLQYVQTLYHKSFILGRPGCGRGGLEWADIRPMCVEHLDDRFTIVSF